MKKLLLFLSVSLLLIGFTSCDLLLEILGMGEDDPSKQPFEKVIEVNEPGDVYLVKMNTSANYLISASDSGKISSITNRSADSTLKDYASEIKKLENDSLLRYNQNDFINKMNNDVIKSVSEYKKLNRAAFNNNYEYKPVITDEYVIGDTKDFWIINNNNIFVSREAVCTYINDYCSIWFIDNNPVLQREFTQEDYKNLADTFKTIYPIEIKVMGDNKYNNHNEAFRDARSKVQIVLCDCMEDATDTQLGGVFGYCYSGDLYTSEVAIANNFVSNEADVIYLDSQFYSYDGSFQVSGYDIDCREQIYSTIAHEYNHQLNNIQKYIVNESEYNIPTWFTEMLAVVVEDMLMETMNVEPLNSSRGRLNYFDNYYYAGFVNWFDGSDAVYASYANAFAYGAFLCRNYGGEKFIHEIATNQYVGIDSINAALRKLGYTDDFDDTVRNFANVLINRTNTGYTLNKYGETYTNGVSLTPIDVVYTVKDEDNQDYTIKPVIFPSDYEQDIFQKAFTIHKIGKSNTVKSITVKIKERISYIVDLFPIYSK